MKSDLRKLAEGKAAQSPDLPESLSPDEIKATLHELRVHQIELEMQNEELRAAQAQIEAGRARYFDLYDLAPVGYCTLSEKGLILEANLTAAALLGTARGALVKLPFSRFIVKDDQDTYYLHRKQLFDTGEPQECELRLVKADGAVFWAHLTATAAREEDGAPVCRVVLSDITERKQAEAALRQSHDIVENVQVGLYIYHLEDINNDRTLRMKYANPAAERMTGVAAKDAVGKTLDEGFPHLRDMNVPQRYAEVVRSREPQTVEDMYYGDDRVMRACFSVKAFPLPKNHVGVAFENISARKIAEEHLQKFKCIVASTSDGIALLDRQYRYVIVNPAYETFSRKNPEELIGLTVAEYLGDTVFTEHIRTHFDHCLKGETVKFQDWFDYPTLGRRFVEVTYFPYVDAEGAIAGVVANTRDITEHRRAEDDLRRSRHLLNATEALSAVGGWEWDVATQTMTWTEGTYRIHDFDPAEVPTGSPEHIARSLACYDAEDRVRITDAFGRCVDKSEAYDLECGFTTAAGRRLRVRTMGRAIRENGRVVKVLGNLQDITEQKRIEQSLRESEARFAALFRFSPMAAGMSSFEDGRIVDVNAEFERMTGFARGDCLGRTALDLGLWANPDERADLMSEAREEGAVHGFECRLRRASGESMPVLMSAEVVRIGDADFMLTMALDISERKRAEQALRESEERFRAANNASLDALLLLRSERDETGQIRDFVFVDLNRRTEEMLRMSREQLLGKRLCEVLPINREAGFFDKYTRVVDTGIPLEEEFFLPETHVPAAWYYHQVVKVGDGVFICHRDIGERKRAEEEREKLQAQFLQAQKMESIGRLAGGVAHDFNNLLMGIMGYADLCRDHVAPEHPAREWLDEITREAERSASLTRQLLAFARKQTIAPKVVDLNDVVASMLKMLHRLIGEDIDLVWQSGAELWSVKIDPSQIDQVLANLCVNARDAISGVGKVTIEAENAMIDEAICAAHEDARPGRHVMLAVSDTGCGMAPETIERIFDPFFTTKDVGEGTGLGLATVYGIVKQNQGFINVYSEPGKGTTFRIYLPCFTENETGRMETAKPAGHVGGSETILLVEDEKSVRVITSRILERLGYTVLTAETPDAALRKATEHAGAIHLLITDVVMPGMSGRDLADRLSATHPLMKCLFISGYTANVIAHCGILDAGLHFLAKPFTRDDIARKVRQLLGSERNDRTPE